MLSRRHRIPNFVVETPREIATLMLGLDAADPRDVLLTNVYRLAARLERRTPPWDELDLLGAETGSRFPVGEYEVFLTAGIEAGR